MMLNAILYGILCFVAIILFVFLLERLVKDLWEILPLLIITIFPIALLAVCAYLFLDEGMIPMIFGG